MATSKFVVGAPKECTATRAKEIAQEKDARNAQFSINAETGAVLTLTGKVFESEWTRTEEGKAPQTGIILNAEAKNGNSTLMIPFGYFVSKTRRAAGGDSVDFKGVFPKFTTNETILNFVKKGAKVKVARDYYFREGWNSETEVTTVVNA